VAINELPRADSNVEHGAMLIGYMMQQNSGASWGRRRKLLAAPGPDEECTSKRGRGCDESDGGAVQAGAN